MKNYPVFGRGYPPAEVTVEERNLHIQFQK